MIRRLSIALLSGPALGLLIGAGSALGVGEAPAPSFPPFFDELEARTFRYFWDLADPGNGLVPDRYPSPSPSSIAAMGFALTAYPIGVERGYVKRGEAASRVKATLRFLEEAPQGPGPTGQTGYRGFFYHFLEQQAGERAGPGVELSTIDSSLLLAGILFCQSYFEGGGEEAEIRDLAERIYTRVDWSWAAPRPPLLARAWKPETGFYPDDWRGYDESMILYLLALGSPTHPLSEAAWSEFTRTYRWQEYYRRPHVNFAPLFGHQYSHVWVDFRGIRDAYMSDRGIDYFENSRRATLAQRDYALENPGGWRGYGPHVWGLTACDGPQAEAMREGRPRAFKSYWARGAAAGDVRDDGTIAPAAALGSLPFAPEAVIPTILEIHQLYGSKLYGTYGFFDAFNPSVPDGTVVKQGRVVQGAGWFDTDYVGIDQGAILSMIENARSALVWRVMKKNPHLRRGLIRAGFRGGWLG
ncbi:MAG TPA: glucoamylase family protein [Vicinamibacteria bacterium]|jgi:hypothetical protein|nr:glucoamylase family protein [Vicinamibacteria bacterium]